MGDLNAAVSAACPALDPLGTAEVGCHLAVLSDGVT
jgi:hypothetical protein